MAHENLKTYLYGIPGKKFVAAFTHDIYKWSERVPFEYYNYRIFEELTIRYATQDKTRLGLEKSDHYRFDAVFFIQPGNRALNQHQCYTVGIELKNAVSDLKYDEKIHRYIGWTNFFMLGVPTPLIDAANEKISAIYTEHPECREKIGLLNVETGEILIRPKRAFVAKENMLAVQEQIIYNCLFNEINTVSFKLEDINIIPAEYNSSTEHVELNVQFPNQHKSSELTSEVQVPGTTAVSTSVSGDSEVITEDSSCNDNYTSIHTGCYDEGSSINKETPEEIAQRKEQAKQQRKENAAREAARIASLAKRGETLPTSTAALYNQLKPNAKEIFWAIVDNEGTARRESIAEKTNMSLPTIDRSLPELTQVGVITHEGSRKTGSYVVTVPIDKSASCDTCRLKDTCLYKGASEGQCGKHK